MAIASEPPDVCLVVSYVSLGIKCLAHKITAAKAPFDIVQANNTYSISTARLLMRSIAHIRPEVLVVIFLFLIRADIRNLLRRLLLQCLQFGRVDGVDILLQHRQVDRHFILVVCVGFNDSKVFADLVGAFGSP